MANTWLFLTLPLTGRQEDPAIKADMLLAIPLQRLVQGYRNHIAGIYQPFHNERTYTPPTAEPVQGDW